MSFKFKINEKSIQDCERNVREAFNKVMRNQQMLEGIAETVVKDIQFQTRRGQSIPAESKFSPLTRKWINMRKKIEAAEGAGQAFSPERSNLTMSGQLLESIKGIIKGPGKILFTATGERDPYFYKTNSGISQRKKKNEPTNEELAEFVRLQGRPFMGVRPEIVTRIKRDVMAFIRRSSKVLGLNSQR